MKLLAMALSLIPAAAFGQLTRPTPPSVVELPQPPDLAPLDLSLTDDCRIVVTLRNNGPGDIPDAGFTDVSIVQMYNDGAPSAAIAYGAIDSSRHTKPAGGTFNYTWGSALAIPSGTHNIRIDVDINNKIAEANEANNSLTKALTCQAQLPDLQPVDIALDSVCRIRVMIRNNGPAPVPLAAYNASLPALSAGLQMRVDSTPAGFIPLGSLDLSHLSQPAGGTIDTEFTGQTLSEGTHTVTLDVDNGHTVTESNEANNVLTKTLTCQRLPDLQPISISLQPAGDLRANAPCAIAVALKNNGPGNVPDFGYASSPGVFLQLWKNGSAWGFLTLGAADPTKVTQLLGGTLNYVWFGGTVTPNLLVPPGTYTFRIDVDYTHALAESNEANNSLTQTVTCGLGVANPE